MPGFNLHFVLANQAGGDHRLGLRNRVSQAAFYAGAVGPDLGYVPGGVKFVSDLSHYVKVGRLAQTLQELASTDAERAFAHGWATHIVADATIHPLINRAAAELMADRRSPSLSHYDHPVAHIRVEQGLDAVIAARTTQAPLPDELRPWIPSSVIPLLSRAYQRIYGIHLEPELRRSCRALNRWFPTFELYGRTVASVLGEPVRPEPHAFTQVGFAILRRSVAPFPQTVLYGLCHPAPPAAWLGAEVAGIIPRFAALFAASADAWPDWNLDTGELAACGPGYPPAEITAAELRHRGGTPG